MNGLEEFEKRERKIAAEDGAMYMIDKVIDKLDSMDETDKIKGMIFDLKVAKEFIVSLSSTF